MISGARANVGLKAGRYMFEARASSFSLCTACSASWRLHLVEFGNPFAVQDRRDIPHNRDLASIQIEICVRMTSSNRSTVDQAQRRASLQLCAGDLQQPTQGDEARHLNVCCCCSRLPASLAFSSVHFGPPDRHAEPFQLSRQLVRVGFSTAGSPLLLGESDAAWMHSGILCSYTCESHVVGGGRAAAAAAAAAAASAANRHLYKPQWELT